MESLKISQLAEKISNMDSGLIEITIGEQEYAILIENSRIIVQTKFRHPAEVQDFIAKLVALDKFFGK